MADSILDQANRAALDEVKATTPQAFTVGGKFVDGRLQGGLTYDRTWKNGLGLTAYLRAWWDDATVSTHTPKPKVEVGGEFVKKF